MQEVQTENTNAPLPPIEADGDSTTEKREMSSIQFPYGDQDDAVSFYAKALHEVGAAAVLFA